MRPASTDIRITDGRVGISPCSTTGADTRLLDWTDGALIRTLFCGRGRQKVRTPRCGCWAPGVNQEVVHKGKVITGDPGTSKEGRERYDRWLPPGTAGGRHVARSHLSGPHHAQDQGAAIMLHDPRPATRVGSTRLRGVERSHQQNTHPELVRTIDKEVSRNLRDR